jgi:hypothetical protein
MIIMIVSACLPVAGFAETKKDLCLLTLACRHRQETEDTKIH